MLNVTHEGRQFLNCAISDLEEAGVPQPVIGAALAAERREAIKAECARRIYTTASQATQSNMNAAAAVIAGKTASARSEQEKAILAGLEAALGWVQAMRGNVATLAADPAADILADTSWPACPAAVADLVSQF